jgi:hypothetical protein
LLVAFFDWVTKGLIIDPPERRAQMALNVFRDPARLGEGSPMAVTYQLALRTWRVRSEVSWIGSSTKGWAHGEVCDEAWNESYREQFEEEYRLYFGDGLTAHPLRLGGAACPRLARPVR